METRVVLRLELLLSWVVLLALSLRLLLWSKLGSPWLHEVCRVMYVVAILVYGRALYLSRAFGKEPVEPSGS